MIWQVDYMKEDHIEIDGIVMYCDDNISSLNLRNGHSIEKVYLDNIPFKKKIVDGSGNLTIKLSGVPIER